MVGTRPGILDTGALKGQLVLKPIGAYERYVTSMWVNRRRFALGLERPVRDVGQGFSGDGVSAMMKRPGFDAASF